jgi:hypothetical protein
MATAACTNAHQDAVSLQERVRAAERDKGKAEQAHKDSTAQLARLAANITMVRALAKGAVERRQEVENQVREDTQMVAELEARSQKAKAAANEVSTESIAANKADKAHKKDADAADYAIKALTTYARFEAAKQAHQNAEAAVSTARLVLETSAERVGVATQDVQRLTVATELAVTDHKSYKPQETADQRNVLRAVMDLNKLQAAHQTLVEAAAEADTIKEVAMEQLQLGPGGQ